MNGGALPVPPEWVAAQLGGATGRGVRVAVIDSGWDRSLSEPRVLPGVGFVDPQDDFALGRNDDDNDVLGHGTACADLVLRVAPDARVIPAKVFGKVLETSPGTLHAALVWALEAGVQVINVSLGTRLENTRDALYAVCEMARRAGIITVAAGHNANDWSYPAIFENVIGVSAARFDSPFSFRYRPEHAMEVQGWGVEQPVLWVGGSRPIKHGTSFAAPNVAGIVALIKERYPQATLEDVREMLTRFALEVDYSAAEDDEEAGMPPARPVPAKSARKPATAKRRTSKAPAAAKPADASPADASAGKKAPARKAASRQPAKPAPATATRAKAAKSVTPKPVADRPTRKAAAKTPKAAAGTAPGKPATAKRAAASPAGKQPAVKTDDAPARKPSTRKASTPKIASGGSSSDEAPARSRATAKRRDEIAAGG